MEAVKNFRIAVLLSGCMRSHETADGTDRTDMFKATLKSVLHLRESA
jgi:hypothetical protein